MMRLIISMVCVQLLPCWCMAEKRSMDMSRYNVVWEHPSTDASGQMPLGNGDIAAGVYAIEDGDLYLLLAKNDALTYNGDIFKTGRVKISLYPNPFAKGKRFKQTLDMQTGSILIEADTVKARVWADANRPVYHVQIDSPENIAVTAVSDLWKRIDSCGRNCTRDPIDPPAQDVRLERDGKILWYLTVGDRSVYPTELDYYDVPEMEEICPDPFRFNTFGNLLESPDLKLKDGALSGKGKTFDIRIHAHCAQESDSNAWVEQFAKQANQPVDTAADWLAHCQWWSDFWNRSWIRIHDNTLSVEKQGKLDQEGYCNKRTAADEAALVTQSYAFFRFMMACQSRGRMQVKFNGGLFTQPLRTPLPSPLKPFYELEDGVGLSHEDERRWGRRFTFQNQRLLYWPLLMSGDVDLMKPFFDHYWRLLPIRKAITKAWFGHEGAYFRENIELTGGERDCGRNGKPPKTPPGGNTGEGYYHSYYFTCGLETVAMMIEYVEYTENKEFRDNVLVPFAREILTFFDKHYQRNADGKIRIDPAMVLETWWVAVNPAPDVAGLQHCLDELLAMGVGSVDDRANWKRFRKEIPEIHLHKIEGRTAIAPARSWAVNHNGESGEMYPVFPFRRFGMGLGPTDKDIIDWTMRHRSSKPFDYCWSQDHLNWAYAGNAREASEGLVRRYRHASTACRFPLYGDSEGDANPDMNHFGAGSIALQRMLVQEAGSSILLLPAWPANWDVDFKLHLARQTTISAKVKGGKLLSWEIEPVSRRGDVVVYEPQEVSR